MATAIDELRKTKKLQVIGEQQSPDVTDAPEVDESAQKATKPLPTKAVGEAWFGAQPAVDTLASSESDPEVKEQVAPKQEIQTQEPSSSKVDPQIARTIGRMVTGATPALFSFLFGPQSAVHGMAQEQAQFAAGKPGKLVPIIGPDGVPVYETPEGAIGEKIAQKAGKGTAPKSVEFLNPKTNKVEMGSYSEGKYYTGAGQLITNPEKFVKPEFVKTEGPHGETIFQAVHPITGEKIGRPQIIAPGEAGSMGKQEYAVSLELAKQYPKEALPYLQKANEANPIIKSLGSPNPDEVRKGVDLARNYLAKTANDKSFTINTDPGLVKEVSEAATRFAKGELSVNEVNAMANLVSNVQKSQIDTVNTLKRATSTAAGPSASNFVEQRLFSPAQRPQTNVPVHPSEHPEYEAAIEWAKAHPDDDRAKLIMQRAGR